MKEVVDPLEFLNKEPEDTDAGKMQLTQNVSEYSLQAGCPPTAKYPPTIANAQRGGFGYPIYSIPSIIPIPMRMMQQNWFEERRQDRKMMAEGYKSCLRREEYAEKQRRREMSSQIYIKDSALWLKKINGLKESVIERKVLKCNILGVEQFQREGESDILWRVILVEERNGQIVDSPLYSLSVLYSPKALKKTIFRRYDCTEVKDKATVWEWIRMAITAALDGKNVIQIPAAPGWFKLKNGYRFYTAADEDTSTFNSFMLEFSMNKIGALEATDVIGELLENLEQITDRGIAGLLLIVRMCVLWGRLTDDNCFRNGIAFWGKNAKDVAKHYMRTMKNDVDIINLDGDRIEKIREKVRSMQDTPVIFLVSNPEERSVQNRLRKILSWMQTGWIEGVKVKTLFAFCFKRFTTALPLDDMIVLNTSDIVLDRKDQSMEKIQQLVIDLIENSGNYWVSEIKQRYFKNREMGLGETESVAKMTVEVLTRIIDKDALGEELSERFQKLLDMGIKEIEAQLSTRQGRAAEIFKDCVIDLADKKLIKVYDREEAPVKGDEDGIYYDKECYYFTTEALQKVCKLSGIDQKSALHIKQELSSMSMLKQYKFTGSRQAEMNVDFRIYYEYGQHKDLSGMAVFREFWDEIGGIALCERNLRFYAVIPD